MSERAWPGLRSSKAAKADHFEDEARHPEDADAVRRPANDDRESIGQILRTLQRRPARTSYILASVFAGVWVVAGFGLGWVYLADIQGGARSQRIDRARARRARRHLSVAGRLLLRPRPYGLAVAGVAADRPIHGRGGDAAGRARDRRARVDRHRRSGDPARGGRHGRRRRARARARRRARDAGRQRGVRARARLQRQRGAHPRAAPGSGRPARHPGRPGRAGPRRHQQRASRSQPRHLADQPARRRPGQRGVAAHHPYAGREGRAHLARARACRRHHDRDARRARRRPARAAGSRQRQHHRRDRGRQRPPDRHASTSRPTISATSSPRSPPTSST